MEIGSGLLALRPSRLISRKAEVAKSPGLLLDWRWPYGAWEEKSGNNDREALPTRRWGAACPRWGLTGRPGRLLPVPRPSLTPHPRPYPVPSLPASGCSGWTCPELAAGAAQRPRWLPRGCSCVCPAGGPASLAHSCGPALGSAGAPGCVQCLAPGTLLVGGGQILPGTGAARLCCCPWAAGHLGDTAVLGLVGRSVRTSTGVWPSPGSSAGAPSCSQGG